MKISKPEFVYMTVIAAAPERVWQGLTTATMVAFGWPHVVSGLKTLLETGEAVDFTAPEESDCPGQQAVASA